MEDNVYYMNLSDSDVDLLAFCLKFTKSICLNVDSKILRSEGIKRESLVCNIDNFLVRIGE